jgi:hypothetical protein
VSENLIARQQLGASDGTRVPVEPRNLAQRPALAANSLEQNKCTVPELEVQIGNSGGEVQEK